GDHGEAGLRALLQSGTITNPELVRQLERLLRQPEPPLPAWSSGTSYSVGDEVSFGGAAYRCRQAHSSQPGWQPPNVYALWARINTGETWAPQVLFQVGDEVIFRGRQYRVI